MVPSIVFHYYFIMLKIYLLYRHLLTNKNEHIIFLDWDDSMDHLHSFLIKKIFQTIVDYWVYYVQRKHSLKFFYAIYRALHLQNPLTSIVHIAHWNDLNKNVPQFRSAKEILNPLFCKHVYYLLCCIYT